MIQTHTQIYQTQWNQNYADYQTIQTDILKQNFNVTNLLSDKPTQFRLIMKLTGRLTTILIIYISEYDKLDQSQKIEWSLIQLEKLIRLTFKSNQYIRYQSITNQILDQF